MARTFRQICRVAVKIEAAFDALRPVWERHLGVLESIVRTSGEPLEGKSVYYHQILTRFPALGTVDLFHVDGGHSLECITADMNSAFSVVHSGATILVDDTNMPHITASVDDWIQRGHGVEVELMRTEGYPHRAVRRLF
jgi:hypothetical protein